MPSARRSRTIAAPPERLWEVIGDPHHLPRWWPRVERVEDVEEDAFTEVMKTAKGKLVRADFRVRSVQADEHALVWEQQLEGTPFARLLSSAETHVYLEPAEGGTNVTIELHQRLTGMFPRFGGFMVRRAAAATLDQALDGLERIGG
ncbi:MAG TPA: SRPBCC family protein [Solirubrobacteraceae bacterium]|nr:SRPBCC family protein [Solirubrobacteraceae bacterium]